MNPADNPTLSVSQVTRDLKQLFDRAYQFIRISGEVTNLKTAWSGHSYFALKEGGAQLQAVLFKQKKRFVDLELEDGQEVVCFGRITIYEPRGSYQMVVDSVELNGTGLLQQRFELLKKKLAARGYFNEDRKFLIPAAPSKIAVISSPKGAAFADFVTVMTLRGGAAEVQLLPVPVQGEGAAEKIATAIEQLSSADSHQVLVLIRGGGSMEDLQAFNEEVVADAIFNCRIPVVTGIGHEIDFTLADFCADHRCATPTAAAELLSPDRRKTLTRLFSCRRRLARRMTVLLEQGEGQLTLHRSHLSHFATVLEGLDYRLKTDRALLERVFTSGVRQRQQRVAEVTQRLLLTAPLHRIDSRKQEVQSLTRRLVTAMQQQHADSRLRFSTAAALLHGVSPLATLARGYSIVRHGEESDRPGVVITDNRSVKQGEKVDVLLHRGKLLCEVVGKAAKRRQS